jgi:hypothetical protein
MFKAILLDFYGTVVEEDDEIIANICGRVVKASQKNLSSEEVSSFWGQTFKEMCLKSHGTTFRSQKQIEELSLQKVISHFNVELDVRKLSLLLYKYWAQPTLFPESKTVISKCNLPICLVSNIDN